MSKKYVLRAYTGYKLSEKFDYRTKHRLLDILYQDRMNRAGDTNSLGEDLHEIDRFEILNQFQEKVFDGNVKDAIAFVNALKK